MAGEGQSPCRPTKFVPVKKLGQGNYGEVYLCECGDVVKIAKTGWGAVLKQEADILAHLPKHTNIVDANICENVQVGGKQETLILVMSYNGFSLYDITNSGNPLLKCTAAFLEEFLKQSYTIFEFLCNVKVLHRDISLRNILLKDSTFILIDYGIARQYDDTIILDKDFAEYRREVHDWYGVFAELREYVEENRIKIGRTCKEQVEVGDPKNVEAMEEMWKKPEILSYDLKHWPASPWMNVLASNLASFKEGDCVEVHVVNVTHDGKPVVRINDNKERVSGIKRKKRPVVELESIARQDFKKTGDPVLTCFNNKVELGWVT